LRKCLRSGCAQWLGGRPVNSSGEQDRGCRTNAYGPAACWRMKAFFRGGAMPGNRRNGDCCSRTRSLNGFCCRTDSGMEPAVLCRNWSRQSSAVKHGAVVYRRGLRAPAFIRRIGWRRCVHGRQDLRLRRMPRSSPVPCSTPTVDS
jgi:hypothetical protein